MPSVAPVLFPDASHLHHMMLQRELFISRANPQQKRRPKGSTSTATPPRTKPSLGWSFPCHGQSRPTKNPKELPRDSLQASTNKRRKRIPSYLNNAPRNRLVSRYGYFDAVLDGALIGKSCLSTGAITLQTTRKCGAVNHKERSYFV